MSTNTKPVANTAVGSSGRGAQSLVIAMDCTIGSARVVLLIQEACQVIGFQQAMFYARHCEVIRRHDLAWFLVFGFWFLTFYFFGRQLKGG